MAVFTRFVRISYIPPKFFLPPLAPNNFDAGAATADNPVTYIK